MGKTAAGRMRDVIRGTLKFTYDDHSVVQPSEARQNGL